MAKATSVKSVVASKPTVVGKLVKSGQVITKYKMSSHIAMNSGSVVNNNGDKVSLKGFTNYSLSNPTIKQHRNIKEVNVYINSKGVSIITCTRTTKKGDSTVLYNHLPQKLTDQLIKNHLAKFNYNK